MSVSSYLRSALRSVVPLLQLTVLSALGAFGCADGSGRASGQEAWTAVVDTVADTISVHTVSGQVWPSDGELVSEVSIGVLDGAPEYQFGQVRALAVDSPGNIYVLDGHGPVIRKYGPDGTYMYDVGREGEGPGEYKRPDSGLVFTPDGRLVLRDPGNGRISIYSPDGDYLDSWPVAGSMNTSNAMIATRANDVLTPVIKNLGASVMEWQRGLARYHPDGTVDTLDVPDVDYEEARISGESENSSSSSNVPFTPQQEVAYSPLGYFVTGVSDSYSFELLRPDAPVVRISRDYEPVPVLPDEKSIRRKQITKNFTENFPGWKWNGPDIPDTKPAYRGFLVSEEGRIWVQISQPSERAMSEADVRAEEQRIEGTVNPYREPSVFDVFEPTGEYLGQVTTPEGFQTYPRPVIRDMDAWAVVTDDLDVARVHHFHVDVPTATELASGD